MTGRRFHVLEDDVSVDWLTLRADEAHHARRVLRLEVGAAVVCFDGAGRSWRGVIESYERETALVQIVETLPEESERAPRIVLAQGLVKGDRMDLIVQKATELGASAIVPLVTDHSEVRLDRERSGRRAARWQRIVLEAAKQCERNRVPLVAEPTSVEHALDATAVAFVERDGAPARGALEAITGNLVTVFVGPEGGWSERERELFREAGIPRLSLGSHILRAETAAIAALAVTLYATQCAETAE